MFSSEGSIQWETMFDYVLLDSGNGRKLERFSDYVVDRPEPKATWRPTLTPDRWQSAGAVFVQTDSQGGQWQKQSEPPIDWSIDWNELRFSLRLTPFKHIGIFPEQAPQWSWLEEVVRAETARRTEPVRILNLFAYTGAATLACAAAGAAVTHIEASKSTLSWARQNAELSGLAAAPIRWIPEDALTFLRRLIKRGETYDGIMLDPPLAGIGPDGQRWQFARHIEETLELCRQVLSPSPLFLLLNDYAQGRPPEDWIQVLSSICIGLDGEVNAGYSQLSAESGAPLLSTGTWARWSRQ